MARRTAADAIQHTAADAIQHCMLTKHSKWGMLAVQWNAATCEPQNQVAEAGLSC